MNGSSTEVMHMSVVVVPVAGRSVGVGPEFSVVLPSCQPATGLGEVVHGISAVMFAQAVSFEVIVVCDEALGTCTQLDHSMTFVRVVPASGKDRVLAARRVMDASRGAWVGLADAAGDAHLDPWALAESLHQARDRENQTLVAA